MPCDVDNNGNPQPLPDSTDFEGLWVVKVDMTVNKNGRITYTIAQNQAYVCLLQD
jgi:hypothetical protein